MTDYSMYHALGQGEQVDPNDPNRTTQPAPPQFNPPIAPQPYQQGAPYGSPAPGQQQFYGGQPGQSPQQPLGYGAPPQPGAPAPGADDGLAAQMGGMSLGGEIHHTARRKKKDRHAFHNVEAPVAAGSAFGVPGAAAPSPGAPAGFFSPPDGGAGPQLLSPSQGFNPAMSPGLSPAVGPQGSQFPPSANPAFSPTVPSPAGLGLSGPGMPAPGTAVPVGGSSFGAAPGGAATVSPEDLPSIPLMRDSTQQYFFRNTYPTFERHVPPPASISFRAFDQGNASPKFARLTMNSLPASGDGLNTSSLPLGLVLQPLAALAPGEAPIPVLDFGESGPPRCRRCRAYINPFMMFRNGGNKFVCNLCSYPNETPSEYFCATTPAGVRVDRDQRPELVRGTVEFVVPKEYWTREPVGMRWLFLIDVTQESFNKGFLEAFCEGILAALYGGESSEEGEDGEPNRSIPKGAKVGFVTFDKDIHFYNVKPSLEQAQMMIMPDIEDPFVPLSEGLFVDPYESKAVITSLLTRLPMIFSTIKNPEPALLPALNAAFAGLEATGGKIICSAAALPTWGPGRLFMRDDGKHIGGEIDKKLLTTEHPLWTKLGERMAAAGVGADFFLASPSGGYLDVATIGHVSSSTGGETFYYPNFIGGRDNAKLSSEIRHAVTRESGYQALMKVRCSTGLQVAEYFGNFIQHSFGADLEIGVIDADKAIGVKFSYDGKLDPKLDAHFQSALLYTTADGQRRVRCTNVIASVSENTRDCMKFVDQDAVYSMLAKEAVTKLAATSSNFRDVRNWITERTIDILSSHRKHFTSQSAPPGQLILPERLKEFAMYMLCLVKCRAFKGGNETSDRRVQELRMIQSIGAQELSLYLYPRIVPIHNLESSDGFLDSETGELKLPPSIRASFSKVEPGGVYLVDNGQQCLIWFHAQTSPDLIADLFGADFRSLQSLDAYTSTLPVLETHLNAQVRNILEFFKTQRGSKAATIQLARQGIDGAEYEFARMLMEDRNNEAQSYVDWLVHVHKAIQLELNGSRRKDEKSEGGIASFAGFRPNYW
ncbi:hypothetical protein jhhlp_002950 [Lomentospora prolificans]|uniref:Uncharacterized protein n=1 Tax=Lomentospora prolificans TaxID=41688 RepID=A0A2N3NFG9_9PEZI|nr:hypothetical protein jhhlp_002950 [Lomentospora prolificans]